MSNQCNDDRSEYKRGYDAGYDRGMRETLSGDLKVIDELRKRLDFCRTRIENRSR